MAAVKINRDALKATSVAKSQEADEVLNSLIGDPSRTDYIKISDGSNILRLFPPHPGSGYTFTQAKVVHRLPVEVDEYDDKKQKTGKKIFISKAIWNAKVHGGADSDLVEEYKRLAEEKSKRLSSNPDKQKEYLKPVYGSYSKDRDKNIQGILPQETWICYAKKIIGDAVSRGRVEIKKAVKNRLNAISALETDGDPLGTDPFTDPDDGKAIKIMYDSKATQPQDYYKVEIYAPTIAKSGGRVTLYPLTDEDIEWFSQVTPLSEIYQNCFTRRDFELQLEGLENFDRIHKMGIFESPEFLELVDQHDALWPIIEEKSEEEQEEEKALPFKKSTPAEKIQQKQEAIAQRKDNMIKAGPPVKKTPNPDEEDEEEEEKPVQKPMDELPWDKSEEKPVVQSERVKPSALREQDEEEQEEKSEAPKETVRERLARLKANSGK